MELIGIAQQIIQVVVPQPSGRPFAVSQALRRSVIVAYLAALNLIRPHYLLLRLVGAITLAAAISKVILENQNLSAEQIGTLPTLSLQVIYTFALFTLLNPLMARFRHLL